MHEIKVMFLHSLDSKGLNIKGLISECCEIPNQVRDLKYTSGIRYGYLIANNTRCFENMESI